MKPIIKIPTTGILQLNVQRVECNSITDKGKERIEDEIFIMISGEDEDTGEVIEEFVTLSKLEARNLAATLLALTSQR